MSNEELIETTTNYIELLYSFNKLNIATELLKSFETGIKTVYNIDIKMDFNKINKRIKVMGKGAIKTLKKKNEEIKKYLDKYGNILKKRATKKLKENENQINGVYCEKIIIETIKDDKKLKNFLREINRKGLIREKDKVDFKINLFIEYYKEITTKLNEVQEINYDDICILQKLHPIRFHLVVQLCLS